MSKVVVLPVVNDRGPTGPCAVCGLAGARPHFLTHGVVVSICKVHRETGYLRRQDGWVFVHALQRHFEARFGSLGRRQKAALITHIARVVGRAITSGPGSYAWPTVRLEAELRYAAGEDPRRVSAQLRRRHSGSAAIVPSIRTLQRWFAEGRWLADPKIWRKLRHRSRRRRNPRGIDYLAGPSIADVIFQPTKAWARKLRPWYPSEDNFTLRA